MTKEQHVNETKLTKELVNEITSYNRRNAFPNNDPSKVSEEDYDRLRDEYLSNFIQDTKKSLEKINSITDNYLALQLILNTDHDIYNKAILEHLTKICTPENIKKIKELSKSDEYQNVHTLPRIKVLEIKQKSWTERLGNEETSTTTLAQL